MERSVLVEVRFCLETVVAIVLSGLVSSEIVFPTISVVVSCGAVSWVISAVEVSGKLVSAIPSGVVCWSAIFAYHKLHFVHFCDGLIKFVECIPFSGT